MDHGDEHPGPAGQIDLEQDRSDERRDGDGHTSRLMSEYVAAGRTKRG